MEQTGFKIDVSCMKILETGLKTYKYNEVLALSSLQWQPQELFYDKNVLKNTKQCD